MHQPRGRNAADADGGRAHIPRESISARVKDALTMQARDADHAQDATPGTDRLRRRCMSSSLKRVLQMARGLFDVDLEEQVADLRKEMSALKRVVARRGADFYEDAEDTVSNYLSQLAGRVGPSLVGLRRQARSAERVAYDHPAVVATVGLVVVGLVASLLLWPRSSSEPARRPRRAQPAERSEETGQANRRRGRNRQSGATAH
jgi:hypothetical protein